MLLFSLKDIFIKSRAISFTKIARYFLIKMYCTEWDSLYEGWLFGGLVVAEFSQKYWQHRYFSCKSCHNVNGLIGARCCHQWYCCEWCHDANEDHELEEDTDLYLCTTCKRATKNYPDRCQFWKEEFTRTCKFEPDDTSETTNSDYSRYYSNSSS